MRLLNRHLNGLAGRLSRHRRRPVAGSVLLLLALVLSGGLYAAFAPAQAEEVEDSQNLAENEELVAKGRKLFLVGCASCHGKNGQGVRTQDGTQLGPPLVGVGAAAVDFQVGTGRMPLARPGVQGEDKPRAYTQEEIRALAAYVASLGPGPEIPEKEDYSLEGLSEEERQAAIARGGQIFRANCTACHNFAGSGGAMPRGKWAPNIRQTKPKYIYEAMLTGPSQMPVFSNGNLTPRMKRDVIAYIQSLDKNPTWGGFELGVLGPVPEGLWSWLIGIGSLVGAAIWIAAHTTRSSKKKEADA